MISVRYNFRKDFLYVVYEGSIDSGQILDYLKVLSEDKGYPRVLRILTNATKSHYDFQFKDGKMILENMKLVAKNYVSIKNAFLHASPRETAFSVVLENTKELENYFHRVFSTEQAALDWLL